MTAEQTMPGWDRMWHPLSVLFRVAIALPVFAVLATGVYLLSVLPDGIIADDMWQQHLGWPDPVPPAWPYWVAVAMALGGFIGCLTWNGRSILRDTHVVGGALFLDALATAVFAAKFPAVDAWPHSLVWAALPLGVMSAAAFAVSVRDNRRATETEAAGSA